MEETLRRAHALSDDLHALASLSVARGGQTWAQGQLALSPSDQNRLTTPLDHRPMLPGTQTYASQRLPGWQAYFIALQADADAQP